MPCILQPNVVKLYGHWNSKSGTKQQIHTFTIHHSHHLPLLIVFWGCRCRCQCLIILCKHISSSFNVLNQITHVIVCLMIYFYFSNGCVRVWVCEYVSEAMWTYIDLWRFIIVFEKTEKKRKEAKQRQKKIEISMEKKLAYASTGIRVNWTRIQNVTLHKKGKTEH